MNDYELWLRQAAREGLLIDTNLLVLLVVGKVNPSRIETYKRTTRYTEKDFRTLVKVMLNFSRLMTLPHVLAEVSNLTDMGGPELIQAREELRSLMEVLEEPVLASRTAALQTTYRLHGLTDAAIVAAAIDRKCAVLTDELGLFRALQTESVPVLNFAQVLDAAWNTASR